MLVWPGTQCRDKPDTNKFIQRVIKWSKGRGRAKVTGNVRHSPPSSFIVDKVCGLAGYWCLWQYDSRSQTLLSVTLSCGSNPVTRAALRDITSGVCFDIVVSCGSRLPIFSLLSLLSQSQPSPLLVPHEKLDTTIIIINIILIIVII